jgi:hypothetical protein
MVMSRVLRVWGKTENYLSGGNWRGVGVRIDGLARDTAETPVGGPCSCGDAPAVLSGSAVPVRAPLTDRGRLISSKARGDPGGFVPLRLARNFEQERDWHDFW